MHKQAHDVRSKNAGDTIANNIAEINMKQTFSTFDLEYVSI